MTIATAIQPDFGSPAMGADSHQGAPTRVHGSYHNHTFRCRHAEGDASDYAQAAVEAGLARLGMADHVPLPDGRLDAARMALSELPAYEAAIADARRLHPVLRLLQGMECDMLPEYLPWYRDVLAPRGYDYLIGSVHVLAGDGTAAFGCSASPAALRRYAELMVSGMESGLFAFIAHPDAMVDRNRCWTPDTAACARDICSAAGTLRIPLELNGLGLREDRGYPWRPFWETAAGLGCRAVASSDAHRPLHAAEGLAPLAGLADELGLALVDPFAGAGDAGRPPRQRSTVRRPD